jgi:hypothetical protein
VKNLFKLYLNKSLDYSLDIHLFRIGKSKGILDEFRSILNEKEIINWELEEFKQISDIYPPKYNSMEKIDAFVFNIDVSEEELEELRKSFWQDLIWADFPPKPIALIFPDESESGALKTSDLLEALSLIRLTDRPWQIFRQGSELSYELKEWLEDVCYTVTKINLKKDYHKRIEREQKETLKAESKQNRGISKL